jgi:hypothetical protein
MLVQPKTMERRTFMVEMSVLWPISGYCFSITLEGQNKILPEYKSKEAPLWTASVV